MKILWLIENVSIRHSKIQGRKNTQYFHSSAKDVNISQITIKDIVIHGGHNF